MNDKARLMILDEPGAIKIWSDTSKSELILPDYGFNERDWDTSYFTTPRTWYVEGMLWIFEQHPRLYFLYVGWDGCAPYYPTGAQCEITFTVCPCPGCCGPDASCIALSGSEWAYAISNWPNLLRCNVCKEAPSNSIYNCIAWTVGITYRWVWQEVDYIDNGGNGDGIVDCSDFEGYYTQNGYPAIVYATAVFFPQHAAIPLSNNCASSKCGEWIRMRHDRNEMEGGVYGYIYSTYNE